MVFAYSEKFYDEMIDTSILSAEVVVPIVLDLLVPNKIESIIDVGCGEGKWLSVFKKNGVKNVFGVDGVWVKPERLEISREEFNQVDLEKPFVLSKKGDLVMSLEVAEHLSESSAEDFIKTIIAVAPVVLFSAAIPHQGGSRHINEQWPDYWQKKFQLHGYVPVDIIRRKIWNDKRVSFFYAQNMLLFVKESEISRYPKLLFARQNGFDAPISLVHPRMYEYYAERWKILVPFLGKVPPRLLHVAKRFLNKIK